MARFKILKDIDNSIHGNKFFKDEVYEGKITKIGSIDFIKITKNGKEETLAPDFDAVLVPDTTPLKSASTQQVQQAETKDKQQTKTTYIAGIVGLGAGLLFAKYRKSGVGGYIGYAILGSIIAQIGYNVAFKK